MQEQNNNGKKNYTLVAVLVAVVMSSLAVFAVAIAIAVSFSVKKDTAKPEQAEEYVKAEDADKDMDKDKDTAEDGKPEEDSDEDTEPEETEETEKTDHFDLTTEWAFDHDFEEGGTITFSNGKSFRLFFYHTEKAADLTTEDLTYYDLTDDFMEDDGIFVSVEDMKNDDFDTVAASIAQKLEKVFDGKAELTINEEGTYVVLEGKDGEWCNSFITEGEDGMVYAINWLSLDGFPEPDKLNSVVSDFLASGIAGEKKKRTGVIGSLCFKVPNAFECDYRGEYFATYITQGYQTLVMLKSEPTEDLRNFFDGKTDTYGDTFYMKKIGTYKSEKYGTITIVEGKNQMGNMYEYYAGNEDGTVDMLMFRDGHESAMSADECEEILRGFVP